MNKISLGANIFPSVFSFPAPFGPRMRKLYRAQAAPLEGDARCTAS